MVEELKPVRCRLKWPAPAVIWLSPECDVNGDGRLWCEDPQEPCPECGRPWVRYNIEAGEHDHD